MALIGYWQTEEQALSAEAEAALDAVTTTADGAGYDVELLEPIPANPVNGRESFRLKIICQDNVTDSADNDTRALQAAFRALHATADANGFDLFPMEPFPFDTNPGGTSNPRAPESFGVLVVAQP